MSNIDRAPLTHQDIEKMSLQYARLLDLRDQKITDPTRDAEIKGIVEYLSQMFIDNADVFIGMWVCVREEYEPWLNLQVTQRERINAITGQRMAIRAAQAAKNQPSPQPQDAAAEVPANVVQLEQK